MSREWQVQNPGRTVFDYAMQQVLSVHDGELRLIVFLSKVLSEGSGPFSVLAFEKLLDFAYGKDLDIGETQQILIDAPDRHVSVAEW